MTNMSLESTGDRLLAAAQAAAVSAYAPYSQFRVGAAVQAGGLIYSGCNIENTSYGLSICAERVAIFRAVADGQTALEAVAICCTDASPAAPAERHLPCGACRQVMAEFASANLPVFIVGLGSFRLEDLLPKPFRLHQRQ